MHVKATPGMVVELGEDWRAAGSCLRVDPKLFFGPDGETKKQKPEREAAARRVCSRCPVAQQCLDLARRTGSEFGVWGGLGESERLDLDRTSVSA